MENIKKYAQSENTYLLLTTLVSIFWFDSIVNMLENLFILKTYINIINNDNSSQNTNSSLLFFSVVIFIKLIGILLSFLGLFVNASVVNLFFNLAKFYLFYSVFLNNSSCYKLKNTMIYWFNSNRYGIKYLNEYTDNFIKNYFIKYEIECNKLYSISNDKIKFIKDQNIFKNLPNLTLSQIKSFLSNGYLKIKEIMNDNDKNTTTNIPQNDNTKTDLIFTKNLSEQTIKKQINNDNNTFNKNESENSLSDPPNSEFTQEPSSDNIDKYDEDTKEESSENVKVESSENVKEESNEDTKEEFKEDTKEESKEDTKVESSEDTKEESNEDTKVESSEDTKEESSENAKVESSEDTKVESSEDTKVESSEDTKEESKEDTKVESSEDTKVESSEDTKVESSEDTKVESSEDTKVESSEDTKVESNEDTKVESNEDTKVESSEDAKEESNEDTKEESSENVKDETSEKKNIISINSYKKGKKIMISKNKRNESNNSFNKK
jgi:hypothetical protein